jgi:hypothetical protein
MHRAHAARLDRNLRRGNRFRKLVLSAIRTVPLFVSWLGGISASLNTKGFGSLPAAAAICAFTVGSGDAGVLL